MKFKGFSREETNAKMRRAEAEFRNGKSLSEVCAIIRTDEDTFIEWARTIPRMGEQLTNSPVTDSVCPIFWIPQESDRMQQVGSGVLLQLEDELFLLTSAHVTDYADAGSLHIPGRDQIVPLSGHFAHNPLPSEGKRELDRIDMAYYRLSAELKFALHPELQPLSPNGLSPFDVQNEGDFYTFVGYPWRKTVDEDGIQASEQVTFSGNAVSAQKYKSLGYEGISNYVVQFRFKKAFSTRFMSISPSPRPEGISGGAIFAWPKEVDNVPDVPALKLVGICHTYHSQHHCMAGTHVTPYLIAIQRNNPWLRIFPED